MYMYYSLVHGLLAFHKTKVMREHGLLAFHKTKVMREHGLQ